MDGAKHEAWAAIGSRDKESTYSLKVHQNQEALKHCMQTKFARFKLSMIGCVLCMFYVFSMCFQ